LQLRLKYRRNSMNDNFFTMSTSKVSKCEVCSKENNTSDNPVTTKWSKLLLPKLRFKRNIMSDNFFTKCQHISKVSSRPGSVRIQRNDTSDDCIITGRRSLLWSKMRFKNQENTMSDNSVTTDQEILKSPSYSDLIQVSSRSCRVYDEGDAINDNLLTKKQCISDFLSKPRETIHQEVPIKKMTWEKLHQYPNFII